MPHPPEHKLRWYQYKLSSLFVLTTLVALACGWYTNEMFKAAKRRKAIAEIRGLGGHVKYDTGNPNLGEPQRWYSWMRKLHGDRRLGNVVVVNFGNWRIAFGGQANPRTNYVMDTEASDADLIHLKDLTKLRRLTLAGNITDAGLVNLKGLTKLESLGLSYTQISDAGLLNLKDLTKLNFLWLDDTQIGDAGLVHLKDWTKLERLNLRGTQVTDAGLVHLKGLTNLKTLVLERTQITDAGLVHLKGLTKLKWLILERTQVTDEGAEKLHEALRNCKIRHWLPRIYPREAIANHQGPAREETGDADRWLPKRITARIWPRGSLPLPPNLRDYYFLGRDLKLHPKATNVILSDKNGYRSIYRGLDLYTLFPVIGGLYCFDDTASGRVSASLVHREEMPPGVKLGKDEDVYVFISFPNAPYRQTGKLGELYVCFGPIEEEKDGEETRYSVKLAFARKKDSRSFREWPTKPDGTVDWKVMRVGDVLAATQLYHYRLLNIVPPDDEGRMIRGHKCKMLGWVEFTRRPILRPSILRPAMRLPAEEEQTEQ